MHQGRWREQVTALARGQGPGQPQSYSVFIEPCYSVLIKTLLQRVHIECVRRIFECEILSQVVAVARQRFWSFRECFLPRTPFWFEPQHPLQRLTYYLKV
jgi:hypothetical protein